MHDRIISVVLDWARAQPTVQAAALVGSHARGVARADSDIDFVILTTIPAFYRSDTDWISAIDWSAIAAFPIQWQDEDYGGVWSRRVWLEHDRGELEISFGLPSWASVEPLDPGTREVIADGCRILHDPKSLLTRLCAAVAKDGA
jgi:uncharacterized protein